MIHIITQLDDAAILSSVKHGFETYHVVIGGAVVWSGLSLAGARSAILERAGR